jgi:uncharacterized protein (TIGR00251 family)
MKISVRVIPNAKQSKIIDEGNGDFKVKVNQVAEDGKANEAVVEIIAEFFKVKKRDVKIISGESSRNKIIEVDN